MRTSHVGEFDAVITIFNAIGHLTKTDFEKTLQVYSAKQLQELLERNGFKVLEQSGIDGSKFIVTDTESVFTVAQKA